jgi:competence protein ComEC
MRRVALGWSALEGTMRTHALIVVLLAACGGAPKKPPATPAPPDGEGKAEPTPDVGQGEPNQGEPKPTEQACGGKPLVVKAYDAGQALAMLVTLPDGRHILVDTGESPKKKKEWHERVMQGLKADVPDGKIELVWITHQHSDHLGGVPDVFKTFEVAHYVDNGSTPKPVTQVFTDAVTAAKKEAKLTEIKPGHTTLPIAGGPDVTLTAIAPSKWPSKCEDEPNDCSIALRIDYCQSSALFVGDAEAKEEELLDVKHATLLQVGHHGSDTSSSDAFVKKVEPSYAIMSPGQPFEGTNKTYCHPIRKTIETLNASMGGPGTKTIHAFNGLAYGPSCKDSKSNPGDWSDVPAADNIFVTSRDGSVTFTTTGNGKFSVATEK